MVHIPVELRRHCLDFLNDDAETLKAVRLSCKDLGTLATQTLFLTAVLNHKEKSAANFKELIRSPLKGLVRHVIVNTRGHWSTRGGHIEECEILETFNEAIKLLPQFEKLEAVELKFAEECAEDCDLWEKGIAETEDFRERVLKTFFGALTQAVKVERLTIQNLQDKMDKGVFESEDFKTVRGRMKRLSLQITTESCDAAPERDIDFPHDSGGFTQALPEYWLKPMATQLTHLTLYGTWCLWGIWPFTDLREIPTFTRLQSLSLGNFTIAHDWQIDWIISHGATLEELLLDDCPIITALMMDQEQVNANFPHLHLTTDNVGAQHLVEVDLRWHQVYGRFRAGLPHLRHFATGHGDWGFRGKAFEQRYDLKCVTGDYQFFNYGSGPSSWIDEIGHSFYMPQDGSYREIDYPECEEADKQVLEALLKDVQQRANMKLQQ
jgi:hypothetical protein